MKASGSLTWVLWLVMSVGLGSWLSIELFASEQKQTFLPGPVMHGHHQIELQCSTCHTDPFGGDAIIQEACVNCHSDELKLAQDSHPKSKFTDPRNAFRLELIDARFCATCHLEHQPEIAGPMGLSQAADYCLHCHQDIGEERESHQNLEFQSCASAGCHNYHDNRALYEDFLLDHRHEPSLLEQGLLPQSEPIMSDIKDVATYAELTPLSESEHNAWLNSSHAQIGMQCEHCHDNEKTVSEQCESCHGRETDSFRLGLHGFKWDQLNQRMTVGEAKLPMKEQANHQAVNCVSCHGAHEFDRNFAAVEACLGCHNDEHSQQYKFSKHYQTFVSEMSQLTPVGSGVSCASCHMPVMELNHHGVEQLQVNHNQSDVLQPNEKMIRPVCMNCHGLGFAIDSLADENLIKMNFQGTPTVHIESIDWATARDSERQ